MPGTGYDRDAERIGIIAPRWFRRIAPLIFLGSVLLGMLLAWLAKITWGLT